VFLIQVVVRLLVLEAPLFGVLSHLQTEHLFQNSARKNQFLKSTHAKKDKRHNKITEEKKDDMDELNPGTYWRDERNDQF
jgi:hypothetical protein